MARVEELEHRRACLDVGGVADELEALARPRQIDLQHLAPRIKAEVLMFTGLMDTICPPSTQFAAFNKITSKKDVVIYPDFGHEGLPWFGDKTFDWFSEM